MEAEEVRTQSKDNQDWDGHESEGESPPEFNARIANAEVEPVRNDDSELVGDEDEGEVGASIVCLRKLRYPRWDDGVDEADANACNDAGADEHIGIYTS